MGQTIRIPAHLRRLDERLVDTDARLREWARHQGGSGSTAGPQGFSREWVTGRSRGAGPAPISPEPPAVAAVSSAVAKLDRVERAALDAEYCNGWMPREERWKLSKQRNERAYREVLSRARWQMKALLGL